MRMICAAGSIGTHFGTTRDHASFPTVDHWLSSKYRNASQNSFNAMNENSKPKSSLPYYIRITVYGTIFSASSRLRGTKTQWLCLPFSDKTAQRRLNARAEKMGMDEEKCVSRVERSQIARAGERQRRSGGLLCRDCKKRGRMRFGYFLFTNNSSDLHRTNQ